MTSFKGVICSAVPVCEAKLKDRRRTSTSRRVMKIRFKREEKVQTTNGILNKWAREVTEDFMTFIETEKI